MSTIGGVSNGTTDLSSLLNKIYDVRDANADGKVSAEEVLQYSEKQQNATTSGVQKAAEAAVSPPATGVNIKV